MATTAAATLLEAYAARALARRKELIANASDVVAEWHRHRAGESAEDEVGVEPKGRSV